MMNLAEYRNRTAGLADYLPWAALVAPGVILNKDGSFQRTARFRGPDLDSATPAELVGTTARLNSALRRLGSGWALFVEAQRSPSTAYPGSIFPEAASALVDLERREQFEAAGVHFESRYYLTFLWMPPAEDASRAESWLYEGREQSGVDAHELLRGFIDRTDRVLQLFEGFVPEVEWLDDPETLTYLHSTVSTKHQRVRVPETPMHLDALLTDQPLVGGLDPRLGKAHLRTLTVIGFPTTTHPGIRRLQEIEAARLSKLFAATTIRVTAPIAPTVTNTTLRTTLAMPAEAPPLDPNAVQNVQDRKLAFVNGPVDRRTVSPGRLANPASPYVVQAGTVIPAALLTGIQSDLPGQVTAQVTEHVFDTPTGKFLLIPQGSRLIGQYDSQVSFGQKRVLLVWNRFMLPDGKSIVLERQQGADARGFSGLADEVDYHWWDLIKAAALSTLLSVGTELGSNQDESDLLRALRRGSQDSINNTGQQLVRRQLNIQPTLTIRQGFPVRVIVNRDLIMAPYDQQEASR